MIYVGNQTLAYPFGWRNDKWLHNVLDIPSGRPGFDQMAKGCSPKECKNQTPTENRIDYYNYNYDYADYMDRRYRQNEAYQARQRTIQTLPPKQVWLILS